MQRNSSSTPTTCRHPTGVRRLRLLLLRWIHICMNWNPRADTWPTSPTGPGWKSTAVMGYSVRQMLRISRRQKANWRLPAAGGCGAPGIQQSSRMAEPIEAGEPLHCGGHAYSTGEVSLVCGISRRGAPSAYTHDGVVGRSQGGVSNAKGDRIDSVQDDERNFSG